MNERIYELAEQAGWDNHHSKFDTRIEKFAELIIKDCAGWVNDNVGLIDEETKADLLKHFGVE